MNEDKPSQQESPTDTKVSAELTQKLTQPTSEQACLMGYRWAKRLASGETAAVERMIATWGLFVGLDLLGYRTRFCYPDENSACNALGTWDGYGDPPGPWIKEKGINKELGKPVDRSNPNL